MTRRMLGILGGMGPEATADLFREVTRLTPAHRDQDHLRVLVYSNPKIPDRTAAILDAGEDAFVPLLESVRFLEEAGAGVIAIACNTAHHYLPRLQAGVRVPILDMIELTCRRAQDQVPGIRVVGLLATKGTLRADLYGAEFGRRGVRVLAPGPGEQDRIQDAIHRIKSGLAQGSREILHAAGQGLVAAGAQAVILGCTEIPLVFEPRAVSYPTLNPTAILAEALVEWAREGEA